MAQRLLDHGEMSSVSTGGGGWVWPIPSVYECCAHFFTLKTQSFHFRRPGKNVYDLCGGVVIGPILACDDK